MRSRTPLRSLPGSLTAAHEGSKLIPDPPSRSCAPVAHTAHQRSLSLSPHFERRRSAGVSVTRRIAGPGAFRGYPHGLTLRVQRGRVRLQWRPATALSYGSLHSTCTAIPPGPRPPSLVAGVYHTSSPRASVSLGVPPHLSKATHAPAPQRLVDHRPCVRGLAALCHRDARPSKAPERAGR